MRKLVPVLLLLAVSASAQSVDKPTRISVFMSNPGVGWSSSNGSAWEAGYGVALERRFSRKWSAELALATEQHETRPYLFNDATFELRTYPVDALVRYFQQFGDGNPPPEPVPPGPQNRITRTG